MDTSVSSLSISQRTADILTAARAEDRSILRQRICALAAPVFQDVVGNALRAVVLTGSLARDEAGFDIQDGRCKVRGDSEFLVVLKDRAADIPLQRKQIVIAELQTHLQRADIDCHVSIAFVRAQYLASIMPHIFAYELRACGVVVTGESEILSLIPSFSSEEIPIEDGWRLLANRITEFMGYAHEWITQSRRVSVEARYRMVKLYLDMATSFLLFESAYEPTYSGRAKKLNLMQHASHETTHLPIILQNFAYLVSLCTRFKVGNNLNPPGEPEILMDKMGSRDFLIETVNLAHGLWRWELLKLTGIDSDSNDRQLMEQWMRLQPISKRVRGWAHVLRHEGWHRSWKHWHRWVRAGWKASPRYWLYSAGCELFFDLPAFVSESNQAWSLDLQRVRSCLVLNRKDSKDTPTTLQQVCSEIILNYREFLEGTRA